MRINPKTLTLARAGVKTTGKRDKFHCHAEDVNEDDLADLVCHFLTEQLLLQSGDSTAVLEGQTFDGVPIRGEDSVSIVPRRK